MALTDKLSAIGNAIRNKTGGTELLTLDAMPTEIESIQTGGDLPEEAFLISGKCGYRFINGGWDWFVKQYGDRVITKDITTAMYMFSNSNITKLPFEINFKDGGGDCNYMFEGCQKLISISSINFKHTSYYNIAHLFYNCNQIINIGNLENLYPSEMNNMFQGCMRLRQLPEFINLNLSRIHTYPYAGSASIFNNCASLRNISEEFLKQIYGVSTSPYSVHLNNSFNSCYVLDEIRGLNPRTGIITANMFGSTNGGTFSNCHRLKNIIFDTQDDGTPYIAQWKLQAIDLSSYIGYEYNIDNHKRIVGFNSGITMDKQVTDDETYQALKNDPDWWTSDVAYSRYNHDSAVATINSLPDTSAYLAEKGGTNVIRFAGASGSATDGGAINTLTEEEIAVAAAKGWTVALS